MVRTTKQLEQYLQLHLLLNSDFKDHSQNSNDGTPTAIEWKPTRRGLKPSFNGSSSIIDYGIDSSLYSTNEITVEAWVKCNSDNNGKCIVGRYTGNSTKYYTYSLNFYTSSMFHFVIANTVTQNTISSGIVPVVGEWYHIVGIYDGTNLLIYINGILRNQIVTTISLSDGGRTPYGKIGSSKNANHIDASIDGVQIYNTTLTADEVLNLYNSTKHRPGIIPAERSYTHQLGIKPEDGLVLGFDGHTKNADGTFQDMSGNSNHGTNYSTSRDVGYFGEVRSFDGVNNYIDCGNDVDDSINDELTIIALVKPLGIVTDKYISFQLATAIGNLSIKVGKIYWTQVYINSTYDSAYTPTTVNLVDNAWNQIAITWKGDGTIKAYSNGIEYEFVLWVGDFIGSSNHISSPFKVGGTTSHYFDGSINKVYVYNRALSLSEIESKFNELATLPLFHINFKDYPDNEDISWTDNEPIPYSTMQVGSNGTFKVDDNQLVCSENTSTLTLRDNHEFDGSEYITIDIDGTKYLGTGTITQGTVTVSVTQGSRFITIAMSDTDVLDSIDIQFRAEVS